MSKRGVSADEKLSRTMDFFHEHKSYFTMKELQKLLPKKGIIAQAVEDVVKQLVDENMVRSEKIGTVNLYWSFPSQATAATQAALTKVETECVSLAKQSTELEEAVKQATKGREKTDERTEALAVLAARQTDLKALDAELAKFSKCDPIMMHEKVCHTALFKSAAQNWTENISNLERYCRDTLAMESSAFCGHFELPVDYGEVDA